MPYLAICNRPYRFGPEVRKLVARNNKVQLQPIGTDAILQVPDGNLIGHPGLLNSDLECVDDC